MISEGYLLSYLAYAKIRFELKKSTAYPAMLALSRDVFAMTEVRLDLYYPSGGKIRHISKQKGGGRIRRQKLGGYF